MAPKIIKNSQMLKYNFFTSYVAFKTPGQAAGQMAGSCAEWEGKWVEEPEELKETDAKWR